MTSKLKNLNDLLGQMMHR
jgi:hypothetical protein